MKFRNISIVLNKYNNFSWKIKQFGNNKKIQPFQVAIGVAWDENEAVQGAQSDYELSDGCEDTL